MPEQKKYILHVNGMHCNACVLTVESELKTSPKVFSVRASLKNNSVDVSGDFGEMAPADIAKELSGVLSRHSLSLEKEKKAVVWKEFYLALPIALGFIALFVLLQKLGIVHLISAGNVTYGTAFVVGIVASLSTCMAVVGGLLLSLSATFARQGDKIRPQLHFHIGRLVAFFLLGGVIGLAGSAFQLGATGTFILGMIIGLVMLALGINLLDIFHWSKRLIPSMPKFLSERAFNVTKMNHTLTPALAGIATFFLPCGFTQSMQIYSLSTGSFLGGALVMLVFALGTLPVLSLISFSSFSMQNSSKSGVFFKSVGLIVILFAIFNIINSLAAAGFIIPVFSL